LGSSVKRLIISGFLSPLLAWLAVWSRGVILKAVAFSVASSFGLSTVAAAKARGSSPSRLELDSTA